MNDEDRVEDEAARLERIRREAAAAQKGRQDVCSHNLDGPFFNMCTAYYVCKICGKRVSA